MTWVSPHAFSQHYPKDVDFSIMITFLDFYLVSSSIARTGGAPTRPSSVSLLYPTTYLSFFFSNVSLDSFEVCPAPFVQLHWSEVRCY